MLVEHAHDIIYEINLEGNFTFANTRSEVILEYSREQILQMKYTALIHPDYLAIVRSFYIKQL
jgi:PAS domain S-box-containing protein